MFFRTPVESPRVPDEPPGTLLGLIAATCMSLGTVQLDGQTAGYDKD